MKVAVSYLKDQNRHIYELNTFPVKCSHGIVAVFCIHLLHIRLFESWFMNISWINSHSFGVTNFEHQNLIGSKEKFVTSSTAQIIWKKVWKHFCRIITLSTCSNGHNVAGHYIKVLKAVQPSLLFRKIPYTLHSVNHKLLWICDKTTAHQYLHRYNGIYSNELALLLPTIRFCLPFFCTR